jgi:hypothetical protein
MFFRITSDFSSSQSWMMCFMPELIDLLHRVRVGRGLGLWLRGGCHEPEDTAARSAFHPTGSWK